MLPLVYMNIFGFAIVFFYILLVIFTTLVRFLFGLEFSTIAQAFFHISTFAQGLCKSAGRDTI